MDSLNNDSLPDHFHGLVSRRDWLRAFGLCCSVPALSTMAPTSVFAFPVFRTREDPPVPGAVRTSSGLILRGMCSRVTTIAPDGEEQRLELRQIDQGYRRILVSSQKSDPVVVNPQDWPNLSFRIPQKATGRRPIPDVLGIPQITEFDADGRATVTLRLAREKVETITIAVSQVNELYAEVIGLTHNWKYAIPLTSIPANRLFPGILERVEEYQTSPWRRLELVRMLMKAGLLEQAGSMLNTVTEEFPELKAEETRVRDALRSQFGEKILQELTVRKAAGQFQLSLNAGRLFPQDQLSPETLLKARQLVSESEEQLRKITSVKTRLQDLPARLTDPKDVARATEMVRLVTSQIDQNNVEAFAPFDLLGADENLSPASKLALAVSGWMMGPNEAIQNFAETWGLFESRQLVLDFLRSGRDESELRGNALTKLTELEGVSPDRIAAMIRNLPAINPLPLQFRDELAEGRFSIAGTETLMGCTGIVPPEYRDTRSYPLLIAFPREFTVADHAVDWWIPQASRLGYIVVVPQAWDENEGTYDASASTHARFLELVRQVKRSFRIDDTRVFVAGHGIGGEAALDMATSHPDVFAGVVSIAGLSRRHLQWTAHNHPDLPWYVVVGQRQGGWYERMGILLQKLFRRESETRMLTDLTLVIYPERGFERFYEETPSVFEWMERHRRSKTPTHIHADLMRSTDLHWFALKLHSLPQKFAELDQPSIAYDQRRYKAAPLSVKFTGNNGVLLQSAPSAANLMISPDLPDIDINKPITLASGRKRKTVDFQPSLDDMLTEFFETGDRERLCYMNVAFEDR